MQTQDQKQKQIRMRRFLKFCVYPTNKTVVMSNNQGVNQWEKDKSLFCRFKLQCKRIYFYWPILKFYIHSEIIDQKRETIPIVHTRLYLNSGEWLWKGISVKETDFCILRIESWCLCCPRLQMKVRRNVFTNMSGPHLPVAKFPNTNTKVTNTK